MRPWWSTTICNMIENFLDGTTNYHVLRKYIKNMDFTIFDIIGYHSDSGDIDKDVDDDKKISIGVGYNHDTGASAYWAGLKTEYWGLDLAASPFWAGLKTEYWSGPVYWSFLRLAMYTGSWVANKVDDHNGEAFLFEQLYLKKSDAFLVNAFTRIFGNSLLVDANKQESVTTTSMSFSVCQNSNYRTRFGWEKVQDGFCHAWVPSYSDTLEGAELQAHINARKRRITKPSFWSEIDGTPGDYVVACPASCSSAPESAQCAGCYPILTEDRQAGMQENTWSKRGTSGACSYGVKFVAGHFCGPVHVPTYNEYIFATFDTPVANNCGAVDDIALQDQHAFQVAGDVDDTNTLWNCSTCKKYSSSATILTREEGRLGCGMYAKTTHNDNSVVYTGPLTSTHTSKSKFNGQMLEAIKQFFVLQQDNITAWIHDSLEADDSPLRNKVFYDAQKRAFFWQVNSLRTIRLSEDIQASYREFGEPQHANAVGGSGGHVGTGSCNDNQVPDGESADTCLFVKYNAKRAAMNSAYLLRDVEDGCIADSSDQEHIEQNTCNPNITQNTVDRIKTFTQQVHENTFGLKLPLVLGEGGTAQTRPASDSRINWIDGVLPFYAAQPRNKGNSKDADYMAYLLDTRKRCEDTYLDKTLREFACYFDADNRIQVVVPWLGKDYAFLKKENRDRVRGQDDTFQSDLGQAQMGVDMCHKYEDVAKKIPCAATTCLGAIDAEVYNQSMCFFSSKHNDYYLEELPNKINLEYLERYHVDNNLFNPEALHSQCYIKYTPYEEQLSKNRLCGHTQAPLGYSPMQIRQRTRVAPSLNRTKVSISSSRLMRDEFVVTQRRYSSLWSGHSAQAVFQAQSVDTKDDLVSLHGVQHTA